MRTAGAGARSGRVANPRGAEMALRTVSTRSATPRGSTRLIFASAVEAGPGSVGSAWSGSAASARASPSATAYSASETATASSVVSMSGGIR